MAWARGLKTLASRKCVVLHKCTNPACASIFRSLSAGKLFLVETDDCIAAADGNPALSRRRMTRRLERFWLCDRCSVLLTLTFERGHGMVVVPLLAKNISLPAARLQQIQTTDESLSH